MARRGFAILFTLLGVAFFISIVGFALLYLAFGREPAVPSNSTLVLRVGGDLAEVAPADVVGYLRGVRTPTVRSIVDSLRKAKVDSRVRARAAQADRLRRRRSGPRCRRSATRCIDFRKSGKPVYAYLEYGGDREYYLATAADKVFLMPSSPLDLTGVATYEVFLRGTLDKIGVYPGSASHRRLQDGGQHVHREGLHAGAQGDGRVAEPRSLRSDRARHRRRPQEERGRGPRARSTRGRSCRRTRCAPAWSTTWPTRIRSTRSCAAARQRRGRSTATTTRASARRRSASTADRASP